MSLDLTILSSKELAETLRTIPAREWNKAVVEARKKQAGWFADLHFADLRSADLHSADLRYAKLRYANLRSAHNDGIPLTIDQWCDIFHMPTVGKGLRVGFKRLPADRITGRDQNNGKHLVEWKQNRWVEAPDWNDTDECGGGLHLSPTAAMTNDYSSAPLLIVVAFDPADAVCLGDKLKVRKCKVIG